MGVDAVQPETIERNSIREPIQEEKKSGRCLDDLLNSLYALITQSAINNIRLGSQLKINIAEEYDKKGAGIRNKAITQFVMGVFVAGVGIAFHSKGEGFQRLIESVHRPIDTLVGASGDKHLTEIQGRISDKENEKQEKTNRSQQQDQTHEGAIQKLQQARETKAQGLVQATRSFS